jgi:hypothetical protein
MYLVYLFALALPLGALLGWLLGVVLLFGTRIATLHRALGPFSFWSILGIGGGLSLSIALNAFTRLGTHYDSVARYTIGAALGGGLLLALLIAGLQPSFWAQRGALCGAPAVVRALVAFSLVLGAVALSYADHTLYVGLYLSAHLALRAAAALLLASALAISADELMLPRLNRRAIYVLCALPLIPIAALREDDSDVVQALVIRPWPATVLRAARTAFDLDRDGFSYVLGGGDCNDFNRGINPGAREIAGNGIDDNCLFGDRAKKVAQSAPPPVPTEPSPMSVVLITLDTVRWDRLGINDPAYGPRGRYTMPNLDRFAHKGVTFRKAFTSGAWTSIAVGTLMRGVHARRLTWFPYYETTSYRMVKAPLEGKLADGERPAKMFPLAFDDPHGPLAHWLQRRGMKTSAVVDDGFSQMLSASVGVSRGFDSYREVNVEPVTIEEAEREKKVGRRTTRDDATTTSFVLSELRKLGGKKEPFFLWAHYFGAHTPSRNHPGAQKFGETLEDQYDHEVRYVDTQIERVLGAIKKLDGKVAVFVTSDHGEYFFKRYRSHGADMHDEVLAIPMVAQVPGWKPQVIDSPVSLVDLMPTILALTKTPAPAGLDGIDLARLVRGEKLPERVLLCDTWQYGNDGIPYSELVSAFDGKHKVVLDRIDHSFSVYDQTNRQAPPLRIEGLANGALARSVLAYLEDTGGQLNIQAPAPAPTKSAKPSAAPTPEPANKKPAAATKKAVPAKKPGPPKKPVPAKKPEPAKQPELLKPAPAAPQEPKPLPAAAP